MLFWLLILLPMLFACVCYAVGKPHKTVRDRLACICGMLELALAVFALLSPDRELYSGFGGGLWLHFSLDDFRKVYVLVIAFLWCMTLLFSGEYFAHYHNRNRYYFFNLMTLGATMGVFLAGSLYTAFIFFEIMSFTSYVWVLHEQSEKALRAANTYLAVAVIGGLVALMGLFLLQWRIGTTDICKLYYAARTCPDKGVLYAAGGCILFGFGAKAGMFPLHIWLPKAHPVAPAPASALLSGLLTKSGIWGILAISCHLFRDDPAWGALILALGTVTMLLGAVLALLSIDLKRTLACSSMSQIGFILVGVGMMDLLGAENALAARGVLLHMVNHSLFKLVLFTCAGIVYVNLHKLDLNEIRGFGRKKPLLMLAFLMGLLGIGGIPGWSGYISKTLLHEAIVEGQAVYGTGWLTVVEWVFLLSGGMTLAYMTKLFVAVFVEKHPEKQDVFNRKTNYMNKRTAFSLLLPAALIPGLGLSAGWSMNQIADLGTDFLHAGELEHAVRYFSLKNLQGAAISLAIGAALYFPVVRKLLMRDRNYVNVLPKKLDLEELLYRPLLTRWLPDILGWIAALFGENKLTTGFCRGILWLGKKLAAVFGENRVSLLLSQSLLTFGAWLAALFGENRVSRRLCRGLYAVGERIGVLFGENAVTSRLSRSLLRCADRINLLLNDSTDDGLRLLGRTIYRKTPMVEQQTADYPPQNGENLK